MLYDRLASLVSRICVFGACVLIVLGIIEYAADWLGDSVINRAHTPSHLIELAAALTVVVIALLLRQIRDQLRKRD